MNGLSASTNNFLVRGVRFVSYIVIYTVFVKTFFFLSTFFNRDDREQRQYNTFFKSPSINNIRSAVLVHSLILRIYNSQIVLLSSCVDLFAGPNRKRYDRVYNTSVRSNSWPM